jgi:hypothetical protein
MAYKEEKEILISHKQAGHPPIPEADQARLLLTGDPTIINQIPGVVQAKAVPHVLYRHYAKLKKPDFKKYFVESDYVEQKLAAHIMYPNGNGLHIIPMPNGAFEARMLERGEAFDIVPLADRNALHDFLIHQIYMFYFLDARLENW